MTDRKCTTCRGEGTIEAGPFWSDDYMRDVCCPDCNGSGLICAVCGEGVEDCECDRVWVTQRVRPKDNDPGFMVGATIAGGFYLGILRFDQHWHWLSLLGGITGLCLALAAPTESVFVGIVAGAQFMANFLIWFRRWVEE
jgi:hypothetical protein